MIDVTGDWDCVTDTPMGAAASVFSVHGNGATFTGVNAGDLGSLDVIDGRIEGDRLIWRMELTRPMPMTLYAVATISGDSLEGEIKLGGFGTATMKGTRRA